MAGKVWSALVRDGTTNEKVRIVDAQESRIVQQGQV